MGQTVVFAVGGGILSAMLFLSAAFGSPGALITTYLSPLPLFLVGLSLGATGGVVAGIVGAVGIVLVLGPTEMAAFAAGGAIPIGLLVHQAVTVRPDDAGIPQWAPPGSLVLWLVGYAAAGILAAAIVTAATSNGLQLVIGATLTAHTALLADLTGGDGAAAVGQLTRFLPAMAAAGWILMTVINAALAQWLVNRFDLAVRPRIEIADIELPAWPLAVLAALFATAYLADGQTGYVALNLALASTLAFFFAGLGVVHAMLRGRPSRPLLLIVFYTAMLWQGWLALLVAGLGVIEQWAGIRRRAAATVLDVEEK